MVPYERFLLCTPIGTGSLTCGFVGFSFGTKPREEPVVLIVSSVEEIVVELASRFLLFVSEDELASEDERDFEVVVLMLELPAPRGETFTFLLQLQSSNLTDLVMVEILPSLLFDFLGGVILEIFFSLFTAIGVELLKLTFGLGVAILHLACSSCWVWHLEEENLEIAFLISKPI